METKADPKKYAKLAEPLESVELASKASEAFLDALQKLREHYHIPELTVSFIIYAKDGDEVAALRGGAGWGDQLLQMRLAKDSFDREYAHAMALMTRVTNSYAHKDVFITDPNGSHMHFIPQDDEGSEGAKTA